MPEEKRSKHLDSEGSEFEKVIDFYISTESDVFVPAAPGLFYANVAVEHAARRWRDLDGLFVESAPVHAQALGGLVAPALAFSRAVVQPAANRGVDGKGPRLTSSWEEKTAKPVPVGLCCSGVRRVQKAMGRPPNWVNQLSSSDWVVS